MRKSHKVESIVNILSYLDSVNRFRLIRFSNLTDKEKQLLILRYCRGLDWKEISYIHGFIFGTDCLNKKHKKTCEKMYEWLIKSKYIETRELDYLRVFL